MYAKATFCFNIMFHTRVEELVSSLYPSIYVPNFWSLLYFKIALFSSKLLKVIAISYVSMWTWIWLNTFLHICMVTSNLDASEGVLNCMLSDLYRHFRFFFPPIHCFFLYLRHFDSSTSPLHLFQITICIMKWAVVDNGVMPILLL